MIPEIHVGDIISCLFCDTPFIVKKIELYPDCEVLTCPFCKKSADIQQYHIHGVPLAVSGTDKIEIPPESVSWKGKIGQ